MHPYLIDAFAAERQAQMLRDAEIARLARKAAGEHRRVHVRTVLGPCTRCFAVWRASSGRVR